MDELYAYSERMVRAALARLADGRGEAEGRRRGGRARPPDPLHRRARRGRDPLRLLGDSARVRRQSQLPLSVTKSACLLRRPLPHRARLARVPRRLRTRHGHAPGGCLVNASAPHAVVAGNTETSSRIVDVAFAALGSFLDVPAQGQGTMNNVALGNDSFTYYETIVRRGRERAPAPTARAASMSRCPNTLMGTPAEALELELPACASSGGSFGADRAAPASTAGGDGIVRELRVLEDCRLVRPRRAAAKRAARRSRWRRRSSRPDARERRGAGVKAHEAAPTRGDVIRIETPGGGGHGAPK